MNINENFKADGKINQKSERRPYPPYTKVSKKKRKKFFFAEVFGN